ncbi:MAG: DUF362 domain-containing protein [Nanoarchaeota archaeon]|nr:DUF362 domain-containing protein [Nanoarchaeota archaeon]
MVSIVAHQKIKGENKEAVLAAVKKAMESANWKKYVKGKKIFLKPNLLSDQLVPGQCTSPWVVEGVIHVVKELGDVEIYVGDADVATAKQVEKAARIWGIKDVCKKEGVKFVNLSKQSIVKVKVPNGEIFKMLNIPKILVECDCIITIPVIKTHNITTMTCSLKNQWGCIPRFRHQYHLVADKCIPELNSALKVKFAVADGTVCLEENGPRVGRPKVMNSVFATNDRVAMDTCACDFMEIDPKTVGHLQNAEKIGLGNSNYQIKGDKMQSKKFRPALVKNHPIVKWELRLRKIPVISYIIFKTPLFKIPAFIASRYNSIWWYYTKGKRWTQQMVKANPLYMQEFGPLLKRINKL